MASRIGIVMKKNISINIAQFLFKRLLALVIVSGGILFYGTVYALSLDSAGFRPNVSNTVYAIHVQTDGRLLLAGDFNSVNAESRNGVARIKVDGSLDGDFDIGTGANSFIYSVKELESGKILIGGNFTSFNGVLSNRIAILNTDGSVDGSFSPGLGAIDGTVFDVAEQNDGKLLVAGSFTSFAGTTQGRLVRLNSDGSLDPSFTPNVNSDVYAIALQPDGKVLLGGRFTGVNGVGRNQLARLHSDGTVDTSFTIGIGPNDTVLSMDLRVDGKLYIGGNFTSFNSVSRNRVALINLDGTVDASFNPSQGINNTVRVITAQIDGSVLIGGSFSQVNGFGRNRIARLSPSGKLDGTFNPGVGADSDVYAIAQQVDGNILAAGSFSVFNAEQHTHLVRLNPAGQTEKGFDTGSGVVGTVFKTVQDADGKLLLGGDFSSFNGVEVDNLVRLNSDGSLDTSFNLGAGLDGPVFAIAVQDDGLILIGGSFSTVNNVNQAIIARLQPNGSIDATFSPTITNSVSGNNSVVGTIFEQKDGKVLIGGVFTHVDGVGRTQIARLNTDGSLDSSFAPMLELDSGPGTVSGLNYQHDGKIILVGAFSSVNGSAIKNLVRLNNDGSLDSSFNTFSGVNGGVRSVAVQEDGKAIIAGNFTTINGVTRNNIARLHINGNLDLSFDAGAGPVFNGARGIIFAVSPQSNGKVLVSGQFFSFGSNNALYSDLVRLNSDGSVDGSLIDIGSVSTGTNILQTATGKVFLTSSGINGIRRFATKEAPLQKLTINDRGSSIRLTHSGASPVAITTAFELASEWNGDWLELGDGRRSGKQWRLDNLNLATESIFYLRAKSLWPDSSSSYSVYQVYIAERVDDDDDSFCFPIKTKKNKFVVICV